jgi:integrase/recombinase XerD
MTGTKKPRGRPPGKSFPARSLTDAEVNKLFSVCIGANGLRNRAILALSFHSGARIGTIMGLSYEQIADKHGKCRTSYVVQAADEKSKRTHRYYISKTGQKIIQDYLDRLPDRGKFPLFPSKMTGKCMTPSSGCTLFKNLLLKAGIEQNSSHCGRKTFITNLYTKHGLGLVELQTLANHSSIEHTRKYIDRLNPNLQSALDNLSY